MDSTGYLLHFATSAPSSAYEMTQLLNSFTGIGERVSAAILLGSPTRCCRPALGTLHLGTVAFCRKSIVEVCRIFNLDFD
jgi:hypothetical protein